MKLNYAPIRRFSAIIPFQVTWFACLVSIYLLCFFSMPGAEKAQLYTLRTAKALAMTAVDVVCSPDLVMQMKEDFRLVKLKHEEWL